MTMKRMMMSAAVPILDMIMTMKGMMMTDSSPNIRHDDDNETNADD